MSSWRWVLIRMTATCFMFALVAAAFMDSDHNPTGLDAPYPHYWLYHLYWIPSAFAVIGLAGTLAFNSWLALRQRLVFILFALVACLLVIELVLEANSVVHSRWLNGISALSAMAPFYVLLQFLLTERSDQPILSEPRQSNSA